MAKTWPMTEPTPHPLLTMTESYTILKAIDYCEARSYLPPVGGWADLVSAVRARINAHDPSILRRFDIAFGLYSGVLDDHLAVGMITPRSAVDRLAGLADDA